MLSHDQVQAALSARLDGEHYDIDDDAIDAHLAGCAECAGFYEQAAALSTKLSFAEPTGSSMAPPADLSDVILAGVESEFNRAARARQAMLQFARIALVVVAAGFAVWAVMVLISSFGLVGTNSDGTVLDPEADPETARLLIEAAAVRLGIAAGLVFAAWRPNITSGMLAPLGTMFFFLTGAMMRDLALGQATSDQFGLLVGLALALATLSWAWAIHHGYVVAETWRRLGADPQ